MSCLNPYVASIANPGRRAFRGPAVGQREGAAQAQPEVATNSGKDYINSRYAHIVCHATPVILHPHINEDHNYFFFAMLTRFMNYQKGKLAQFFFHFAGAEAEAEGGEAAGAQPAGEAEERAGGPQEDTRTQTGGLSHQRLLFSLGHFFHR